MIFVVELPGIEDANNAADLHKWYTGEHGVTWENVRQQGFSLTYVNSKYAVPGAIGRHAKYLTRRDQVHMTAHPVDSTYYRCCDAIGRHAHGCTTAARKIPLPEGPLWVDDWTEHDGDDGPTA